MRVAMKRVVVMSIISLRAGTSSMAAWVGASGRRQAATDLAQIWPCRAVPSSSLTFVAASFSMSW